MYIFGGNWCLGVEFWGLGILVVDGLKGMCCLGFGENKFMYMK